MNKPFCLAAGMYLLVSLQASAQDVMQSIMDANASSQYNYMTSHINKTVMADMYKDKNLTDKAAKSFTYYKTSRLTSKKLEQITTRMKFNTQVVNQLNRYDFDNPFTKLTAGYQLKYNDVADIMTAYQVQSWLIANSVTTNPARQAVNALRSQVRKILASNTTIINDEKARAQIGEEIKILFVLENAGWQGAKQKGNFQAYSDAVANKYQQQYKQDLRKLKLDGKGMHL